MSTPSNPAAYDAFAWFYDRYWNEQFHSRAFPIVERVLLGRLAPGATILDVGCGTGYLASKLADRGFRTTGVDGSPAMVACARRNAPQAAFEVSPLRCFRISGPFAAAVSTFDTLNHLVEAGELASAMRHTAAALQPGGLFFFDMLLEDAYLQHWQETSAIVRDDHVLIVAGEGYNRRSKLARCRITMFRLEGEWRRRDVIVTERCYSRRQIDAALARAGFARVDCYDARDLGMDGELGAGRVFFLAELSR